MGRRIVANVSIICGARGHIGHETETEAADFLSQTLVPGVFIPDGLKTQRKDMRLSD